MNSCGQGDFHFLKQGCKRITGEEFEMKIAIPTDQPSIASKAGQSFGRAAYFLIYDTDSKAIRSLENHAAASQGGTGVKAAQIIVDSGADVLLTPRCGGNAAAVLLAASIKLYKTSDGYH
jgi:predicted Fe-Mo cluster-binding NifX family protein